MESPATLDNRAERNQGFAAMLVGLVPAGVKPNHLTCIRMLGSLVILAVGLSPAPLGWIVVLGIVSGLSDNLDGMVARHRGQVSELGALLDPLADKLFAAVLMVVLWWRGLAEWQLLALVACMDMHAVVIPLLVLVRRLRLGQPLLPGPKVQTNGWGKAKTAVLALGMGFIILGATYQINWLIVLGTWCVRLAVILGFIALLLYFRAYRAGRFA